MSNWVSGLGSSWSASRLPFVYCWACWESFVSPGAKMRLLGVEDDIAALVLVLVLVLCPGLL